MFRKENILCLLLVLLMLAAASLAINRSLFGSDIENDRIDSEQTGDRPDPITELPDGMVVIHTVGMEGTADGYAGPVPLDIYIKGGKITDIQAPENSETPGFFERASKLFEYWIGMAPSEAIDLKVDAVSGATYSSNAIISNMNAGLAYYDGVAARSASSMPWKEWFALGVSLAACIIPLFIRNRKYHLIQMMCNVIVLGFWCGQFLDYNLILKYMSAGVSLPIGLTAILMLVSAFIYPLFGKPQYYCTHVCPLGSAQQLMGQICGFKMKMTRKTIKALDWFRRILWCVLMISLWTDCLAEWMNYELFQAFQFESASWWVTGAAIVFLLLSLIVNRPYCRFVCPTGSLFKRAENMG